MVSEHPPWPRLLPSDLAAPRVVHRSPFRRLAERLGLGPPGSPTALAALGAVAYAGVASAYVALSSRVAAVLVSSPVVLARIEEVKGVAFVLVTAAVAFPLLRALLSRNERLSSEVLAQHDALLRAERHALAGTLAATVAHDVNNVLSVMRLSVETLALDDRLLPDQRELVHETLVATGRLAELAGRLRDTAGAERGAVVPTDLVATAREAVALVARHERVRGCELRVVAPRALVAAVQPVMVRQIVWNLVLNAADAVGGHGRIEVVLAEFGERAVLEVHDDGPGISAEQARRALAGGYTSRAAGSGLGLLSVRHCAQAHRGGVEITSSKRLGGACVTVWLDRRSTRA